MNFKDLVPALKNLIVEAAVKQAMARLITLTAINGVSFLTFPVIGPVVTFIVTRYTRLTLDETVIMASVWWIMLDLYYETKSAEEATLRLREILDNPLKYSAKQMKEIEENFDNKAVELIHLAIIQY